MYEGPKYVWKLYDEKGTLIYFLDHREHPRAISWAKRTMDADTSIKDSEGYTLTSHEETESGEVLSAKWVYRNHQFRAQHLRRNKP